MLPQRLAVDDGVSQRGPLTEGERAVVQLVQIAVPGELVQKPPGGGFGQLRLLGQLPHGGAVPVCPGGLQQPEVLPDGHRRLGAGPVTHGTSMDPAPGSGKAGPAGGKASTSTTYRPCAAAAHPRRGTPRPAPGIRYALV